jgi:hypothetical protein
VIELDVLNYNIISYLPFFIDYEHKD